MVVKFFVLFALVAAVSATDFNFFAYGVADPYTLDYKKQFECRTRNKVEGQYSFLEADGTHRIVDYTAGANGFNAVVRRDPPSSAETPAAHAGSMSSWGTPDGYNPYAYNYGRLEDEYTAPYSLRKLLEQN